MNEEVTDVEKEVRLDLDLVLGTTAAAPPHDSRSPQEHTEHTL